ncbi:hypothetical protein FSP39_015702 [Pinctada imbricata]|uniref:Sodium/nucleoside cotransporter n=1 Tax=Pinctada imbricata TaxID=66713 RepID=A0AA88YU60_PINIB|nr:hypothetical protein FSP39_015702 [Pinctada imbricata]
MQFTLGILILRWPPGYAACKFLGDSVTVFLSYTDAGSKFVFGDPGYTLHAVAFQILPVVVFFSAIVSILYFLGVLQFVIKVIAKSLEFLMQTTPMESFATAAHIFIGQVESSVALKPFLATLTDSELNAVMTSGFATVAGTVIAAYVEFGVPAEHVISASFMSAPAALAVAKLNYPELKDIERSDEEIELDVGNESNIMEAAAVGAMYAVKLIAYVVVNLIAFLAILAFLDAVIAYFASKVGFFTVDFEYVISYLFMPLAVVMGVPWDEAQTVGKLIAKKVLANEFLAYADLGQYITSGQLQVRTIVISTYILCGFGSSAAMGINLGALSAAEPKKRSDFAKLLSRAFIEGNIACFMTACIAGILYQNDPSMLISAQNLTVTNSTSNFTTVLPQIFNVTGS